MAGICLETLNKLNSDLPTDCQNDRRTDAVTFRVPHTQLVIDRERRRSRERGESRERGRKIERGPQGFQ